MTYKILCRVSGGVTGTREAYLKSMGVEQEFATREAAEAECARLRAGVSPYSTASFRYTVVPMENSDE